MKTNRKELSIVSGVGFRSNGNGGEIGDVFNTPGVKPNIGACVTKVLYEAGHDVVMLSRTEEKMARIKDSLQGDGGGSNRLEYIPVDLLDTESVNRVVESLDLSGPVNLIHSVGLSAGMYKVPNDNPYLEIEDTPIELPVLEFEIVVKSLLILVRALLPLMKKTKESKIVVVSSMSGIRAFPLGYSHASAKAGLHHAVRSLTLELAKSEIYVSEVLPGIVNTGLYDNPHVMESVDKIAAAFGYKYEGELPQIPPIDVAEAVKMCLTSKAHILSVNMVSKGQWPNIGA